MNRETKCNCNRVPFWYGDRTIHRNILQLFKSLPYCDAFLLRPFNSKFYSIQFMYINCNKTNYDVANKIQRFLHICETVLPHPSDMCLGSYYDCCLNSNKFTIHFFFCVYDFHFHLFCYPISKCSKRELMINKNGYEAIGRWMIMPCRPISIIYFFFNY